MAKIGRLCRNREPTAATQGRNRSREISHAQLELDFRRSKLLSAMKLRFVVQQDRANSGRDAEPKLTGDCFWAVQLRAGSINWRPARMRRSWWCWMPSASYWRRWNRRRNYLSGLWRFSKSRRGLCGVSSRNDNVRDNGRGQEFPFLAANEESQRE